MTTKAFWVAVVIIPAFALPPQPQQSRPHHRLLDETLLLELFASGDVTLDLSTLLPNTKIFVPNGSFFNKAAVNVPYGGATAQNIDAILTAAVQTCTPVPQGSFATAACTLTSNTVFEVCATRPSGQYRKASCVTGDISTVGSNAVYLKCNEPADGWYTTTVCGDSDTATQKCQDPTGSQYTVTPCNKGSSSAVGTNTVNADCKVAGPTQYVKTACTRSSNTEVAECLTAPSGSFIQTACVQGNINQAGYNSIVQTCTAPPTKKFTRSVCTSNSDTVFSDCSDPASGWFTKVACDQGNALKVGQNTQTQQCQTPTAPAGNQWRSATCVSGSWSQVGQDASLTACNNPVAGVSYTTAACQADKDTTISACSTVQSGYYLTQSCTAGSYSNLGSDTKSAKCDEPSATQYVTYVCTTSQNTQFQNCKVASLGTNYVRNACKPGASTATGTDADVPDCTKPVLGTTYTKSPCTTTSDTSIGQVTQQPPAGSYVTAIATTTSDIVTATCLTAGTNQYINVACAPGSATLLGKNTDVQNCKTNDNGYYISTQCTTTSNAQQSKCTEPQATGTKYVSAKCTSTSDTGFSDCLTKTASQYFSKACTVGTSSTLGDKGEVKDCTDPSKSSGRYTTAVCTNTVDTTTAACKVPGASDFSIPCQTGTNAALGADTKILPVVATSCGGTSSGNTDPSRNNQGDSVYSLVITEEAREVTFKTCGSDTTLALFKNPSTPVAVTTTPCQGAKGVQAIIELTAGTYFVVVTATSGTAQSYQLAVSCSVQTITTMQRYQLFTDTKTYTDALALCTSRGMYLAHVTSVEESNALGALVKSAGVNSAWIGINDIVTEGYYKLSFSDDQYSFSKWAPGEPNNVGGGTGEDCVEVYQDGNWNDLPCSATRPVACSKYKPSLMTTTKNQMYVFFNQAMKNSDANKVCVNNGMRLAHITNAEENTAVRNLINPSQKSPWIGINDLNIDFYFVYAAFNTPLQFTNWASGEPNNYQNTHEACVHTYPDGNWNDLPCANSQTFVCSTYIPSRTRASDVQFYVHFDEQVDFRTAQASCFANGMNLALVSSDADRNTMTSFFTSVPQASVWVGAFSVGGNLQLDGASGAPAVFKPFNAQSGNKDYCVESDTAGKWNEVACSSTRRYVCSAFRDTQSVLTDSQLVVTFPNTFITYSQAVTFCTNYGMHLTHTIPSAQTQVGGLTSRYTDMNSWVGNNDIASEGKWVYELTTRAANSLRWNVGEPNNAGDEDCGEIRTDGTMNDVPCGINRRVTCSKFLFESRTTRRFVIIRSKDSSGKLVTCETVGLFSDPPQSAVENAPLGDFVKLLSKYPGSNGLAIMGATKNSYGKFVSDGTGKELTWFNWAAGEPNGANEKCLQLYTNGLWNDLPCDQNYSMRVCVV